MGNGPHMVALDPVMIGMAAIGLAILIVTAMLTPRKSLRGVAQVFALVLLTLASFLEMVEQNWFPYDIPGKASHAGMVGIEVLAINAAIAFLFWFVITSLLRWLIRPKAAA